MKSWTDKKKAQLKELQNLHPEDRLACVADIAKCIAYVSESCNGWGLWLTNPVWMAKFGDNELIDIFTDMEKIAIEMVKIDIKYTGKKEKLKERKVYVA